MAPAAPCIPPVPSRLPLFAPPPSLRLSKGRDRIAPSRSRAAADHHNTSVPPSDHPRSISHSARATRIFRRRRVRGTRLLGRQTCGVERCRGYCGEAKVHECCAVVVAGMSDGVLRRCRARRCTGRHRRWGGLDRRRRGSRRLRETW